MGTSLRLMRQWDGKGWSGQCFHQCFQGGYLQRKSGRYLLELVNRYGITPKRLHLEITESVYTENPDELIRR